MANEDLIVKIKADIKSLQAGLRQAVRESNKAGQAMGEGISKGPIKALDEMKGKFSKFDAITRLPTFLGGLAAVQAARALVDVSLQYERVENTLKAVTGSASDAADELAFLVKEADRLGVSIAGSAQSYAQFLAAVKGTKLEGEPARQIFLSILEASGKLGLSVEKTEKALLALNQMMSKGTIQAEELKGQLGDALPIAMQVMSRAAGVTTAELMDMMKEGQLISDEMLPKFAEELRKTLGTDATSRIDTNAASFARLRNEIGLLAKEVGGPLTDALANAAEGWSRLFKHFRQTSEMDAVKTDLVDLRSEVVRWQNIVDTKSSYGDAAIFERKQLQDLQEEFVSATRARDKFIQGMTQGIMGQFMPKPIAGADVQIPRRENAPDVEELKKQEKEAEAAAKRAAERAKALTDAKTKQTQDAIRLAREGVMSEIDLEEYKYEMQRQIIERADTSLFKSSAEKAKLLEEMAQTHAYKVADIEIKAAKQAEENRLDAVSKVERAREEYAELEEMLLTHEESALLAEEASYRMRLDALARYSEQAVLLEGEYAAIREQLELDHFRKLNDIRANELTSGFNMLGMIKDKEKRLIADRAASTIATMATYSRKAFEINKGINIAQATIDTYKAVQKARAEGGPFLGPILAGIELAAGIANIAAIKKTTFGGGGASGSVAGAANPNNTTQPQGGGGGGTPQILLSLAPGRYSDEQVRDLIAQINEAYADGARVR
jgi:tape measure domain-containing protein